MKNINDFERVVISSKHVSTIAWLSKHHPEIASKAIYDPYVRRHNLGPETAVVGSWPVHLVNQAGAYFTVELDQHPRSTELSVEEMETLGARLKRYVLLDEEKINAIVSHVYGLGHSDGANNVQPPTFDQIFEILGL